MTTPAWDSLSPTRLAALHEALQAAQKCQRDTGVPACVSLAQWALESLWGEHHCGEANNYFGIKAGRGWRGPVVMLSTKEWSRTKGWYVAQAPFRKYASMAESFADHGRFLRDNKRYAALFAMPPGDYKSWCRGLRVAGYATDPKYADMLISVIERYGFQFYNLGKGA